LEINQQDLLFDFKPGDDERDVAKIFFKIVAKIFDNIIKSFYLYTINKITVKK
jgi:hypothetical protein